MADIEKALRGISIHPPRAGRDGVLQNYTARRGFQSTRPVRGGTNVDQAWLPVVSISIHPPRAGRDKCKGLCIGKG